MLATAFAGLIAAGITSQMEGVGGKKSWEWLFIIEGAMTVVIAVLLLPLMTDYPLQSKHIFLPRDLQLLAVSIVISRVLFIYISNIEAGVANPEGERWNCRRRSRIYMVGSQAGPYRPEALHVRGDANGTDHCSILQQLLPIDSRYSWI